MSIINSIFRRFGYARVVNPIDSLEQDLAFNPDVAQAAALLGGGPAAAGPVKRPRRMPKATPPPMPAHADAGELSQDEQDDWEWKLAMARARTRNGVPRAKTDLPLKAPPEAAEPTVGPVTAPVETRAATPAATPALAAKPALVPKPAAALVPKPAAALAPKPAAPVAAPPASTEDESAEEWEWKLAIARANTGG